MVPSVPKGNEIDLNEILIREGGVGINCRGITEGRKESQGVGNSRNEWLVKGFNTD